MAEEREESTRDEPVGMPEASPQTIKRSVNPILPVLLAVALVFGISVGTNHWLKPTPDELRSTVFDDGEFDGTDFEGDMSTYTRTVRVDAHIFWTAEEVRARVLAMNPGISQLPEEEQQATLDQLDEQISNLPTNEDGYISQNDLSPQFRINPAAATGVLLSDSVVVPSQVLATVLGISGTMADRVTVTVTLLADADVEDEWKKEELFNGSASELVVDSKVYVDKDYGLTYLERPAQKALVDPGENPYEKVSLEDISDLDAVVYPRSLGTLRVVDSGRVTGTIEDRGLILIGGHFSTADMGAPVFLVRDGNLVWAGMLTSTAQGFGVVVSADTVESRMP
ncbi:MAG: hypothetical protein R3346_00625 [Candidatus Spechtbacterales bacterium]|nr:hypothetical protein [Candidatus Spechtbacterales bacterium]